MPSPEDASGNPANARPVQPPLFYRDGRELTREERGFVPPPEPPRLYYRNGIPVEGSPDGPPSERFSPIPRAPNKGSYWQIAGVAAIILVSIAMSLLSWLALILGLAALGGFAAILKKR